MTHNVLVQSCTVMTPLHDLYRHSTLSSRVGSADLVKLIVDQKEDVK